MLVDLAHRLRLARLGAAALAEVPGALLRIGRDGGGTVTVGAIDDHRTEVLPCHHRAALAAGLSSGSLLAYLRALGLLQGGGLHVELLLPPGADVGSGVVSTTSDSDDESRLVVVSTLCPHRAALAARRAHPVTANAVHPGDSQQQPTTTRVRTDLRWDKDLLVTVIGWTYRAHPSIVGPVEDMVRAAAAACAVDELEASLAD